MSKRSILHFALSFCILIFVFSIFNTVDAATLSLSPSSGSYSVGQTFTVTIYVASTDQAMNAVSASISFPSDLLQVVSLSKTSSIITNWVQEPSFSNNNGTITLEGIVLNPGYQGSSGRILSISFKAKSRGTANVTFTSSSVLANDGLGTNILKSITNGQYLIKSTSATEPGAGEATTPISKTGTPQAIKIQSSTHPDPNNWYQDTNPKFTWSLSEDITKIAFTLDQKSSTVPNKAAEQLITSYQYQDLKEGVWYFHLQAKNALGWGDVSHFKVQIDKTPPESFKISINNNGDETNPQPYLSFETKDALSDIDHYEIQIDNQPIIQVLPQEIKNGKYQLPITPGGTYQLLVRALDKASNFTIATETLTIQSIKAPIISEYSEQIQPNEPITIKGTAASPGTIEIFIQNEAKEIFSEKINTDDKGNWDYVSSKSFKKGIYAVWVQFTDKRGAISEPSEIVKITVNLPLFIQIGNVLISYLSIIISLVALIIFLVLIILYGIRKIKKLEQIKKIDFTEEEKELYQIFVYIKNEMTNQIANLDGQPYLSDSEAKILENLKKILDIAQKGIIDILKRRGGKN
ncbi:MAG: hypothetical protein GYA31_00995 [Parcubacteria group bacterium]|nr:hypothetical protein [Parcubacteria group bacterium]